MPATQKSTKRQTGTRMLVTKQARKQESKMKKKLFVWKQEGKQAKCVKASQAQKRESMREKCENA